MKLNNIDEVSNSATALLCDVFGLLSSRNLAIMATWRNDFSPLLTGMAISMATLDWVGVVLNCILGLFWGGECNRTTQRNYSWYSLRKGPTFRDATTGFGFPRETCEEFPMALHYLYLGSASNTIGCKFASSNQKNYPDPGSDESSVWNFRARFSDIISRGNQWWCRELSAVFSGCS